MPSAVRRDDPERAYPELRRRHAGIGAGCATCCARAMEAEGFTVFESEWWHFDYRDWREYLILNAPFEQVRQGSAPVAGAWKP